MNRVIFAVAVAAAACACSTRDARLEGRFAGVADAALPLELLTPGHSAVVDTIKTDAEGNFSSRVHFKESGEAIYNIHVNNGVVPLVLAPGERVKLNSAGNIALNYTVDGSPGSQLMASLNFIMMDGASRLDSLSGAYGRAESDEQRQGISREYLSEYYRIKREQVRFIVTYPGSLAAVYALYQRLPGDNSLTGGDSEVIYYRTVADSLQSVNPRSPYLPALRDEIHRMEGRAELQRKLSSEGIEQINFPEIELPDMYGKKMKLSSMEGRVILIDFWSASAAQSRLNNAELKELYAKYHDRGLEIYQVGVDTQKQAWVSAVQEQKLPWTTVCDFRGTASPALRSYNVTTLPANILIDSHSNIAGRNLYGDALERKVASLIN